MKPYMSIVNDLVLPIIFCAKLINQTYIISATLTIIMPLVAMHLLSFLLKGQCDGKEAS